mmetsp:Transcript_131572/g.293460  ORF Transcript_131572/g.293460 Transcript_131572/m.293460 type:complete len:200 (-) Transcript_131572:375-974(-)
MRSRSAVWASTTPWPDWSLRWNFLCNARNLCRLFPFSSAAASSSWPVCPAAAPMRAWRLADGSSASQFAENQRWPKACNGLGRWARSLQVIQFTRSCSPGMVCGKRSQGIGRLRAAAPKSSLPSGGVSTPCTVPLLLGTWPAKSWKKTTPKLKMSPRGYHNPVCHVSGGMYPGVPQTPSLATVKPRERPKSMSTGRGAA